MCVRFVFVFMIIFIFIYRKMQIADERTFFCAGKKKENLCVLNRIRIEKPERRFLSYCFSYTFSCGGCGGRIYGGLSSFQWGSVCVRMCVSNISCNNNIYKWFAAQHLNALIVSIDYFLLIEVRIRCCLSHCQRNLLFTMSFTVF